MPVPSISVIIISYNSENFIEKCLSSLLKNLPLKSEVIVLDNASSDSTVEKLTKFIPQIKLIKSSKNLGFATGCNKATQEAKGEYLFFLNPDTEINTPVLEELVEFYGSHPNAGIVAPKLIMPDGKTQPSAKKLPTIWGAFKEYILGIKNSYSQYVPEGDNPQAVEMVYGAAILIKKDLFERLKGFDEKFFLYYEDADLCKRVAEIGKKVYYCPQVSVTHLVGGTRSDQDKYKLNLEASIKYHGFFKSIVLQIIFRLHRLLA